MIRSSCTGMKAVSRHLLSQGGGGWRWIRAGTGIVRTEASCQPLLLVTIPHAPGGVTISAVLTEGCYDMDRLNGTWLE